MMKFPLSVIKYRFTEILKMVTLIDRCSYKFLPFLYMIPEKGDKKQSDIPNDSLRATRQPRIQAQT